jgi:hypothetical protein
MKATDFRTLSIFLIQYQDVGIFYETYIELKVRHLLKSSNSSKA